MKVVVHHHLRIQMKNQLKKKKKFKKLKKLKSHHHLIVIQMIKNHLHLAAAHLQKKVIKTKVKVIKKVKKSLKRK
jgi:hypothetical protein